MANDLNIKKSINYIFDVMEYGFQDNSPTLPLNWIKNNEEWINYILRYSKKTAEFQSSSNICFLNSDTTKLNYPEAENEEWLRTDKFNRVQVLQKLASLLEENALLFAHLDALERSIPVSHILDNDVSYLVQYFRCCAFMPLQLSKFAKKFEWKTDSIGWIQITRLIPLYELCWNISPYLICGRTVKLAVDNKSVLLILLFLKLCHAAGIPEDVLRLESIKDIDGSSCYYSQSIALVFDGVDLNSAVDGIIEGCWSHNGLVPWCIKRVLVQEPISEVFIQKVLKKMQKLKCGDVFSRLTNFSKPHSSKFLTDLHSIVSEADSEGLKVHQVEGCGDDFIKPTLIIGRPQCLFQNMSPLPVVTVESFRSLEESLKLVENGHFFTSASLWTNSYSVLQKASLLLMAKTDVQTLWINIHGILDPSVPFVIQGTPHGVKEDLCGHFFMKSFPEVTVLFNPEPPDIFTRVDQTVLSMSEIENILSGSLKAQTTWRKFGSLKRLSLLSAAALKLLNHKTCLESYMVSNNCEDESVESLVEFIITISSTNQYKNSLANSSKGESVIISQTHRGVVLLQIKTLKNLVVFLRLLTSFIAFGNSVIIITNEADKINMFYDILKCDLPLNLVSVINCNILNTESLGCEIIPDVEVLAIKTYISKTVWLAN